MCFINSDTLYNHIRVYMVILLTVITNSGGGILLGSMSDRKSLMRACSEVQRRIGSRVSIRSSRSRAAAGKLKRIHLLTWSGRITTTLLRWQHLYVQGKFFPQSPPILLFGFHGVEEGKFYDVRPDSRTGTPTQTANH